MYLRDARASRAGGPACVVQSAERPSHKRKRSGQIRPQAPRRVKRAGARRRFESGWCFSRGMGIKTSALRLWTWKRRQSACRAALKAVVLETGIAGSTPAASAWKGRPGRLRVPAWKAGELIGSASSNLAPSATEKRRMTVGRIGLLNRRPGNGPRGFDSRLLRQKHLEAAERGYFALEARGLGSIPSGDRKVSVV